MYLSAYLRTWDNWAQVSSGLISTHDCTRNISTWGWNQKKVNCKPSRFGSYFSSEQYVVHGFSFVLITLSSPLLFQPVGGIHSSMFIVMAFFDVCFKPRTESIQALCYWQRHTGTEFRHFKRVFSSSSIRPLQLRVLHLEATLGPRLEVIRDLIPW